MSNPCSIPLKYGRSRKHDICYPDELIQEFVVRVLKKEPDRDIKRDIDRIHKYMISKYDCHDQTCWDKYSQIFKESAKEVHLPDARWSKKNRLISNYDVSNIMKQYEFFMNKRDPKCFKYLSDWDYDQDKDETFIRYLRQGREYKYNFILMSLWGRKKKFLKHWVCIFIDNINRDLLYYDSAGIRNARYEMVPIFETIKNVSKVERLIYNKIETQYDYENCGIFCIHLLGSIISGYLVNVDPYETFDAHVSGLNKKMNNLGRDKYYEHVMNIRDKYFVPPNN